MPKYYVDKKEPKTLPGRSKGLVLVLDAHTDMFSAGSVESDFDGFAGYIGGNATFPLFSQGGFEIRPGTNLIKLLASARNKLECLSLASLFQPGLALAGKASRLSYKVAPEWYST